MRLRPCISGGAGSPATSRNVGAKSMFRAIASLLVPGLMPAGHRTRNGIRIDSSYMNRLSNSPWSPRKNPWSLVYTTIVLSASPAWSRNARTRPTLSSTDCTVAR